jgi:serine/threonine protein kinase
MILPADPNLEKLSNSSPQAMIGALVADRYRIIDVAGAGGMGVVYKAEQIHMSRSVALKMLLHGADEQAFKRFRQEARAASLLDHPNIVGIHDFDVINGSQAYLVMDFLDGISLSELVRSGGPIPIDRFVHMFLQACDALEHAHQHGVVHRDIKPSNLVLVEKNGDKDFLKIVDFGLVKLMSDGEDQKLTSTNMVMGSPLYMSPQQCRGLAVDHRTDIYSLGCVMYEALTGKPPLSGDTPLDTLYKHISAAPLPMAKANPNVFVPLALEEVIQKSMAKDLAQRQQNMAELREQLQASVLGIKRGQNSQFPVPNTPANFLSGNSSTRPARTNGVSTADPGVKAVFASREKQKKTLVHWALPVAIISLVSAAVIGSLIFVIFQQQKQEREVLREAEKLKESSVPPRAVVASTISPSEADRSKEAALSLAAAKEKAVRNAAAAAAKDKAGRDAAVAKEQVSRAKRAHQLEKGQLAEEEAESAFESHDWEAARRQFETCLRLQEQVFGKQNEVLVPTVAKLTVCCWRMNDTQAANEYLNRFSTLYKKHPQPLERDQALLQTLSRISHDSGIIDLSERLLSAAIIAHDNAPGAKVVESLEMRLDLAHLLGQENRPVEEEKELRQVLNASQRNPRVHRQAGQALVRFLRKQGRNDEADNIAQSLRKNGDSSTSDWMSRLSKRRQRNGG